MTTKEVERVVHKEPFQPFRLVLANGEEVVVRQPRKSHVSGDQVALVGECRRNGGTTVERFRLIGIDRIVTAEAADLPPRC